MKACKSTHRRRSAARQGFVLLLGCVIGILHAALAQCQPGAAAPSPDAVAATVGGEPITVGQVLEFVHRALAENHVTAQTTARVDAQALAQLIDRKLISLDLDRRKISVGSEEVEAALKKAEDQTSGQPGGLKSVLAGRGISLEAFRSQLAWDLRWAKYLSLELTDSDLREYFSKHRAEFDGTEVRVSHLLLRPNASHDAAATAAIENKALTIRQEILAGRLSFADAARKYSDGPSRRQGGDLGYIPRRNQMVEAFSAAAFRLKKGEVSEPVVTPFGVHLIQCTDIKPGAKHWDEVRDALAPAIAKSTFRQLADEMRADVSVQYTGVIAYLDPHTGRLVPAKP